MFCVVLITCPSEKAEVIARTLVEERLAASVNILPNVTSFYWWTGKINRSVEVLLLAKTRFDIIENLKRQVRELHPYEVPQIIAFPIATGSTEYLDWLDRETRKT